MFIQRSLLRSDPYSFATQGQLWINHSWLSDLVIGVAFQSGQVLGLVVLRAFLLILLIVQLARLLLSRMPQPYFVLITVLLLLPIIDLVTNLRPQLFAFVCFISLLLAIEKTKYAQAVCILILWANMHGSFLFGIVTLLLSISLEYFSRVPGTKKTELLLFALATVCVPFLTLYGFDLPRYLIIESSIDHSLNEEWGPALPVHLYSFGPIVVLPILVGFLTRQRPRLNDFLLWIFFVVLSYKHGRFIPYAAILCAMLLASQVSSLHFKKRTIFHSKYAQKLFLTMMIASLILPAVRLVRQRIKSQSSYSELSAEGFPEKSVQFLQTISDQNSGVQHNIVTPLEWGGFVIWKLFPRYKVSLDGRNLMVYSPEYVNASLYKYATADLSGLFALTPSADMAILPARFAKIAHPPGWKRIYEDDQALIYSKEFSETP